MTDVRLTSEMTPNEIARNMLLLRASETLSSTTTARDVVAAVDRLRCDGIGASRLSVHLLPGRVGVPAQRAIDEQRALYFEDSAEFASAFPTAATPDAQAVACVPVVGTGSILGVLEIRWDGPRTFYVAERAVIATLATYVAQALERAQRLDVRAGVADILQQAILPCTPAAPPYEFAACYLPADRQQKVGGDWYDAVTGTDGRLTLVIGDVVGHDMPAAAQMGQLRSMLRAYIVDRHESPSALLHRLDAANHALGEPIMATAVVAAIHTLPDGQHRLHWSNAGHPPPVLIRRDGSVRSLGGGDLLLGASRNAPRHTSSVRLAPGSTVLLHTDGLVERPGRAIDDNYSDLHQRLRTARRTRLENLLEDAIASVGPDPTDDIAVLAVRLPADK